MNKSITIRNVWGLVGGVAAILSTIMAFDAMIKGDLVGHSLWSAVLSAMSSILLRIS